MRDESDQKQTSTAPAESPIAAASEQSVSQAHVPSDKYAKHRWKFLVFGGVSGVLMGVYSPTQQAPGSWFGDLIGGVLLWYILWWLWAWSRRRKDRADA